MSMVTQTPGGRISGRIHLTFQTSAILVVGDPVHIVGDYVVAKADGTKPIVGFVEVANVKRVAGNFPVGYTPGIVTVEVRGWAVRVHTAGGTIVAGALYGVGAAGAILPPGAGVMNCGIALTGATNGNKFDGLLGLSA